MPTFKRCDSSVSEMAAQLMKEFHPALLDNKVKLDLVFAFGDRDDVTGNIETPALVKGGVQCRGIARKLNLKDRAKGNGDAEIALDGDYWETASEAERRALLDHELHHIVATGETDDLRRPKLRLRPHDYEFGWFKAIAERHGIASQERILAKMMMDEAGQYFWPVIEKSATQRSRFSQIETARA